MCNMTEQEKTAWTDLKNLVVEYSDACRTGKDDKKCNALLDRLNAALDLYHNNKIINVSEKDVANLKIGFCGIRKYSDAVKDVINIIEKLSGEKKFVKQDVMQGVMDKIFNSRQ